MTERDLVTSTDIESSPLYTQVQKNALGKRALTYLQSQHILINTANLQGASSVILDSLTRGLAIHGEPVIKPRDSIKKYVDAGLRQREERTKQAAIITREARYSYQFSRFQGPFALDSNDINFALYSAEAIPLLGDISPIDSLCMQVEERVPILEQLYNFSLDGLPEGLRGRARMRIQQQDEKSKIVRNTIVSILATGNAIPLISMEDIARYIGEFKQADKVFTPQNLERMKVAMEVKGFIMGEREESYIDALFSQVADIFNGDANLAGSDPDRIFQRFGRVLLLLHPALEELPIVTSQGQINIEQPSLWDERNSVNFDGKRLPKKEILMAAARQADARKAESTSAVMRNALKAWTSYESEARLHPRKIQALQRRIDELDGKINRLQKRSGIAVPSPTANLEYDALQKSLSEVTGAFYRNNAILEEEMDERDEIEPHIQSARKSPDGKAFLPRSAYVDYLSKRIGDTTRAITRATQDGERNRGVLEATANSSLQQAIRKDLQEILKDIYLRPYDYEGFAGRLYEALLENTNANIFNPDVETSVIRNIVLSETNLSFQPSKKRKEVGLVGNRELVDNLQEIGARIRRGKITINDPSVLNAISVSIALRFKNLTQSISTSVAKGERSKAQRSQLETERQNLVRNPEEPLPTDAKRPLKWFEDRKVQLTISSIPREITPELQKNFQRFQTIQPLVFSYCFPLVIPSIEELKEFLTQDIARREAELEKRVREYETNEAIQDPRNASAETKKRIEERKINRKRKEIANMRQFHEVVDDPALQLRSAYGLKRTQYMELLGRKKDRILRFFAQSDYEQRIANLLPKVKKAKREKDLKDAMNDRERLQRDINTLTSTNTPVQRLIQRMDRLGLVLRDDGAI